MLLFLFFGGQMIIHSINGISYRLRTAHDLSWLSNYGRVFSVVDETGSGCICFGVENPDGRFFFKIAGADTIEGEVSPAESVTALKNAEGYAVFASSGIKLGILGASHGRGLAHNNKTGEEILRR